MLAGKEAAMATKKASKKAAVKKAAVTKSGTIKYADPDSGYGYILADDASDASDTVLFELVDVAPNVELEPGSGVEFELDPESSAAKATRIETAKTAETS
jgi:cold shock CspA family protein